MGKQYRIPGHPDHYATEDGKFWKETENGPVEIRPVNTHQRYLRVHLQAGQIYKPHTVHTLLCLLFHGRPGPDQYIVRHLNDNSHDNSKANLAWGNNADNERDKVKNGRGLKRTRTPKIQRITEYIPANMFPAKRHQEADTRGRSAPLGIGQTN